MSLIIFVRYNFKVLLVGLLRGYRIRFRRASLGPGLKNPGPAAADLSRFNRLIWVDGRGFH